MGGDPRFTLFTTLPKGDKSFWIAMFIAVAVGMVIGFLIADSVEKPKEDVAAEAVKSSSVWTPPADTDAHICRLS